MSTFISVILGLLSIIGWILLVLLCIIILIILIILFVPIRYKMEAMADTETIVEIHVKWFFKLFYYHYFFHKDKQTNGIMKFFGKTLFRKEEIHEKKKEPEETKERTNESVKVEDIVQDKKVEKIRLEVPKKKKDHNSKKGKLEEKVITKKETADELIKVEKKVEKKATGLEEELEEQVKEKDSFGLKDLWGYPYKKEVIYHTYVFIKRFVKHILPDVLKVSGEIGMEDPAITGYIVGVFSIFSTFFGNDVHIVGNFQQKIIKGSAFVKGKIYIGTIIKIIIMYIWEKPVRNIIKQYFRKRKDEAYGK